MPIFFAPGFCLLLVLAGFAYRRLWLRRPGATTTPKGFGALLPFFLLATGWLFDDPAALMGVYAVTCIGTAIYWWDDIFGDLSRRIRLGLQFFGGCAVGALMLHVPLGWSASLIAACIGAGVVNVILVNAINFFDGADLNSSTMTLLVAVLLIAFSFTPFVTAALMIAAFILAFMAWNHVPNRLWFGDSGCYAVACLSTAIFVYMLAQGENANLLPLVPVAWAVFDAFVVFIIRVSAREDLLSRNFHHLYQKMQQRFGGWYYLLPQFANVAAVWGTALVLARLGLPAPWPTTAAAIVATPLLYLGCRRLFVR
jgi:UDP-N-acetylmuramyl pentapeptide phosphotransferase/UDP-N-acetylglucosamine-1-phosphate transferase